MENKKLELSVIIEKEEFVKSLNHDIVENTFVLEIDKPFPGYYGSDFITQKSKPNSILFLVKDDLEQEYLLRINKKLNEISGIIYDMAFATVKIYNQVYKAIRLRHLGDYNEITYVQNFFINEGIFMLKPKPIENMALLRIYKTLLLEQINEFVFQDNFEKEFIYFEIPHKVEWEKFEKITKNIKNSFPQYKFDAATVVMFFNEGVKDLIRLYKSEGKTDNILNIRNIYLRELEKHS